ncbi:VCBS repeat-containing protein [Alkalibacillus silvisoli]|uniref:VCBS repeat-containing protein n=1 Tax=Alkalibacillus silvisoli TaxID=392823 RepID=A0ABP3JVE8_9BACI
MFIYGYRKGSLVVDSAQGDVTGDGVVDRVVLTGDQPPDSPLTQNIILVVQGGVTGQVYSTPIDDVGYDPTLFLGDFTGDGVDEIMVTIPTGGSGGIMNEYIYSFSHNRFNLVFDSNAYNDYYQYQVSYLDGYKVKVISEVNQQQYMIDLSNRDLEYLSEIYNDEGQLLEPIEGWVNPLSGLYPVDFNLDGVYDLLAYQQISGRYRADGLGYVLNTLQWDSQHFGLNQQSVAIFGSDI